MINSRRFQSSKRINSGFIEKDLSWRKMGKIVKIKRGSLYYCPKCERYWGRDHQYYNKIHYLVHNYKVDDYIKKYGIIDKACRNCNFKDIEKTELENCGCEIIE
jgi:hypothetical protein